MYPIYCLKCMLYVKSSLENNQIHIFCLNAKKYNMNTVKKKLPFGKQDFCTLYLPIKD